MNESDLEQAHAVIAGLLRKVGIEPTPSAIVEVLNHSQMSSIQKLAIAIAEPCGESVESLNAAA